MPHARMDLGRPSRWRGVALRCVRMDGRPSRWGGVEALGRPCLRTLLGCFLGFLVCRRSHENALAKRAPDLMSSVSLRLALFYLFFCRAPTPSRHTIGRAAAAEDVGDKVIPRPHACCALQNAGGSRHHWENPLPQPHSPLCRSCARGLWRPRHRPI